MINNYMKLIEDKIYYEIPTGFTYEIKSYNDIEYYNPLGLIPIEQ